MGKRQEKLENYLFATRQEAIDYKNELKEEHKEHIFRVVSLYTVITEPKRITPKKG